MSLAEVTAFLRKHGISSAPVVDPESPQRKRLIGYISEADCLEYLSNEVFFGCPSQPQTVQTMMKRHPVCVGPETDLFTLASVFVSHGFRHLPVVEGDRLVGIVSRRDVLRELDSFYQERITDDALERFPPNLREVLNLRFLARK
ncbi:MAG: CBS domain-containing protein [Planctomycetaceae bacterium]|nr:CBS domain-containing protein [Planctomycetaceae bacterium]